MKLKPSQITESVAELKILIRNTSTGYQKQRLTALFLFRSGQATTRKQISKMIGIDLNVLVLDNGCFHQAKTLRIPDNVILLFLPPYSPELNPIERLWQDIKAKVFQNVFASIKEMQDKLTEILRKYTKTTIQNITKYDYLTKIENEI